jgi:hypothetical protein
MATLRSYSEQPDPRHGNCTPLWKADSQTHVRFSFLIGAAG